MRDDLRPNEKYRLAKVVDITGDIITLVYGNFYYQHKHAAINSIYYGQLSYKNSFEPKRYDYPLEKIQQKLNSNALYLAKRPVRGKLFGQRVTPELRNFRQKIMTPGYKKNVTGEAFLNERFSETNLHQAFDFFLASANYNFAQGQVNLAQMYINGQHVEKNLNTALYWLNKASLQSNKSATLKYEIICQQVPECELYDFFKNLKAHGVDVNVREIQHKSPLIN